MSLNISDDEIFTKTVPQSSSRNVHHVTVNDNADDKHLLIVISLDGTIHRFYFVDNDISQIVSCSDEVSNFLDPSVNDKEILVTSSELISTTDNSGSFYLLICINLEEEYKLLLLKLETDRSRPITFCDALSLAYYPVYMKTFKIQQQQQPQEENLAGKCDHSLNLAVKHDGSSNLVGKHDDSSYFLISGSDNSLNVYVLDKVKSVVDIYFERSIIFPTLKLPGVCLCMDFLYFPDYYWCAVGLDTGDLYIYKFSAQNDAILTEFRRKFDTPISFVTFLSVTSSSPANENSSSAAAANHEFYLMTSSTLGPASMFGLVKSVREKSADSSTPGRPKLMEICNFLKSERYDVIVSNFAASFNTEKMDFTIFLGTFSYHMLTYRVNLSSKICQLTQIKEFLSPVISMLRIGNYFIVITCTGLHLYDVK